MRELWLHQKEALARAASLYRKEDPQSSGFALLAEPGVGKTATAIHILRHWMNAAQRNYRTLIFCPPIVVSNWKEEFKLNSKIDPSEVVLLRGSAKQRLKLFDAKKAKAQVFVTNYESLLMEELYAGFMHWQPEALIADESHYLKSPTAKRSKRMERLANSKNPPFKQILTGTPMLKDPMDLFMQFLILDGGQTLGTNFYVFRGRYFRDRNAGMPSQKHFPNWHLMTMQRDGFDALSELNKLIGPRSMSVKKEDCLDLPPLVRQVIKVPMAPEQARLYEEMKQAFITYLGDKACVASLAITKALRLQQIASGYIKTDEHEEITLDNNPKLAALEELLKELTPHSKVLVWAVWRSNYGQIKKVCEKLGIGFVEIHGGISDVAKQRAVAALASDPLVRVVIGHPGSGGIGVNLIQAAYSIFYSRSFSLGESIQAEARNYRGGSEIHAKVTRYDLVAEGSIDELVQEKLALKIEMSESLLRDLSLELKKQETEKA